MSGLCRLLLRCCPRDFREAYGREILELAQARLGRTAGTPAALAVLARTAWDILWIAAAEWWARTRRGATLPVSPPRRSSMRDRLWLDVRDGVRRLAAAPVFTVLAVLMLAVGIGGSSVIFSAADAFALRPQPFARTAELVYIYQDSDEGRPSSSAYPAYLDVRSHTDLFAGVGAVMPEGTATLLSDGHDARVVRVEFATASYLPVLGLQPALGRWFLPEEDQAGAPPSAVLTHAAWLRRFGGDPQVLGRTMRLSGGTVTIVGVGPASYNGFVAGVASEAWLSISALGPVGGRFRGETLTRREDHWFQIVARLAPGRTLAEAQAAMRALADRLGREFPETDRGRRISALSASDVRIHPDIDVMMSPLASAPFVLIALVLTLVCSNLANITLARGVARRRDIAVRLAIGATRAQVVRSLTLESLLLSFAGGATGLAVAWWSVGLLGSWHAPVIEAAPVLGVDARVIAFAVGLSLVTGLAFGLLPALQSTRAELRSAMTAGARGLRLRDMRGVLVAVQVAICVLLLAAGGMLLRSMFHALRLDPGFEAARLALATLDAGQSGRPAPQAAQVLLDLCDRIAALPTVDAVAITTRAPATRFGPSTSLVLDDHSTPGPDGSRSAELRFGIVTPAYFRTLGIPLLHGREFTAGDRRDTAAVAIVSRAMAVRFWSTTDVVGRRYRHEGSNDWVTIIGVAGDVTIVSPGEAPVGFVYRPFAQRNPTQGSLIVRTAGDPAAVLPAIREQVRAIDHTIPIMQASTMEAYVARSLVVPRTAGMVLASAAALAFVLACLGVYSVVAFTVVRRRTEMGVRMALGATGRQVATLVLGEMVRLVSVGVVAGTAAAVLAAPLLRGLLVGTSPIDPVTFLSVAAFVAGASLLATWVPARRAALADPAAVLRAE